MTPELDAVKAAAEAQADADCERGLADLAASLASAPEYKRSESADGKAIITPVRASLAGMLTHLRASMERQRARRGR